MSLPLKPFGKWLVVRLLPEPPKSDRLVVIAPEQLTRRGEVTAIGGLVKDVSVGWVVLVRANRGTAWEADDTLLIPEEAVLCRLEDCPESATVD